MLLFNGSYTANLPNGLIAYDLLRLRGKGNLAGWQWLFLVGLLAFAIPIDPNPNHSTDGLATLTIGIATLFLLPRDLTRGNAIVKINPLSNFSKRKTDILLGRIVRNNPYNTDPRDTHLSQLQIVFSVLTNWKVWMHCSMVLLGLENSPLGTYSPSIIKTFGYGTFNTNLLTMPNSALLIITTFCTGVVE